MVVVLQISVARSQSPGPLMRCVSRRLNRVCSEYPSVLQIPSIEQYAMRAFSSALDAVPLALAENSGLSPIETLAEVKSRQINEGSSKLGIDCNGRGENG
jgi:chaperonin GroEL (HSP60 family)